MADFYLTLPSNATQDSYLNNFIVHLPRTIKLNGDWEVALVELQYPHSWFNIGENDNEIKIINQNALQSVTIPLAHYSNITQLIETINEALKQEIISPLQYSQHNGRVSARIEPEITILVSTKLMYMMGFDSRNICASALQMVTKDETRAVATHPPDISAGLYSLYLYCGIVAPQIVGSSESPLLRVVNIDGHFGDYIDKDYVNPHYVPILQKHFDRIEINIKNDVGELIPFEYGKVVVKLHFRKKRR